MVLIEGIIKLKFAILHSGATINDGDKSERSNGTKDSWTSTKTCYESPKKEKVSRTLKHLITDIKSYNEEKI